MLTIEELEELIKVTLQHERTLQQMINKLYAHRRELVALKEHLESKRNQIAEGLRDDLREGL